MVVGCDGPPLGSELARGLPPKRDCGYHLALADRPRGCNMALYALTIFLSAFLLFLVQPLLGHYILPWFGGSPAVWTTCMLFFQCGLLAGYAYAHALVTWLSPRAQGRTHMVLLGLSLLLLPITPSSAWRGGLDGNPTLHILLLLARTVGAPYLLISATGPLLQGWFSRTSPGRSPYRLYALSNLGSLLALIAYPVLVEPSLRLRPQTLWWTLGYVLFAACCATVAWRVSGLAPTPAQTAEQSGGEQPRPRALDVLLWLALAGCGSLMLLATTNQLCQDVAVVPFLWVLPLGLYLLSFILCFDREQTYVRGVWAVLLALALFVDFTLLLKGLSIVLLKQILGYNLALFVCCMACHGELVRLKPAPRYLTLFYLMVSLGGALAGLFVALVAPKIFTGFYELHAGLLLTGLLYVYVAGRDMLTRATDGRLDRRILPLVLGVVASGLVSLGLMAYKLGLDIKEDRGGLIEARRNFYGVLKVDQVDMQKAIWRKRLMHGRILHGHQYQDPSRRSWRSSYYSPGSGVGIALEHCVHTPRRLGVVGLGTGSMAAWGEQGDTVRFYDINPAVRDLCAKHFTYVQDSRARGADTQILMGDARLVMEQQLKDGQPQQFDVLAIDAFSGDAIPVHLMTLECARVYWQHLKPDGVLAFHISNRYLDLKPIAKALADQLGKQALLIENKDDERHGVTRSEWVLLTSNQALLDDPEVVAQTEVWPSKKAILWTDDFTNLYQVLKLK